MIRRPLAALAALLAGCSALAPDPMKRRFHGDDPGEEITLLEIENRTRNFADRYVQLLVDSCDDLKATTTSQAARREAHQLKLRSAASAFDIVTSAHPLQEMLDLMVQVELQVRIWKDEGRAEKIFGDRGPRIVDALDTAQKEIVALASRAMKHKDIEGIRRLAVEWRKRNPDVSTGAFMRFGPYLDAPGGTFVTQVLTGFGILNLSNLNPLDPAAKSVNRVSETADDVFYMAKRAPMLLEWQLEAAAYDLEIAVEGLSKSGDSALQSTRALAKDLTATADAARGAIEALGKVMPPKDPDAPKGKPLDIAEVGATARDVRGVVEELRGLVESPGLGRRLDEVRDAGGALMTRLFGESAILLALFFALLVAYRLLVHRLKRNGTRPSA